MSETIRSFTDLTVWKQGHQLALEIYRKTQSFPKEERYGLVSQMRRASVSVTSNIAEGFARYTYKDKLRFYYMSLGSLVELQNQLILARDIGYIDKEIFIQIAEQATEVHKILNAFISRTKSFL